jgi:glutathione S-transferase
MHRKKYSSTTTSAGHTSGQMLSHCFAGTSFSVADIAVASMLINFHYAGESVQEKVYPKLYRYLRRVLARDSFRKAFATEVPAARAIDGLDMKLFTVLGF